MRVMPFVQVFFLLTLLALLLLTALENPGLVRLPLPLGQGELLLSVGSAMGLFMLLGGSYVLLLLLPLVWQNWWRRRQEVAQRRQLERQLSETLAARLAVPSESRDSLLPAAPEGA